MSIRDRVTQDMKAAMAARDQARLDALRLIRAEILKADKETGQPIDDDQQMAVLQKMLKQRQEAIEQYVAGGRPEQAEQERAALQELAQACKDLNAQLADAREKAKEQEEVLTKARARIEKTFAGQKQELQKQIAAAMDVQLQAQRRR